MSQTLIVRFLLIVALVGPILGFSIFGSPFGSEDDVVRGELKNGAYVEMDVLRVYADGLSRVQEHARTGECKAKIEIEYMKMLRAVADEEPMAFEDVHFHSQCPLQPNQRTVQPPLMPIYMKKAPPTPDLPPPPKKPRDPLSVDKLRICYVILVHNHTEQAKRLIESLDEVSPRHTFVVHVDQKAPTVHEELTTFAKAYNAEHGVGKIHILQEGRQRINWGGYTMVNATMAGIHYAMADASKVQFDYLVLLSGSTYPIQSNKDIRHFLSGGSSPSRVGKSHMIYSDVNESPTRPKADMWHTYVECDDRIHRIGRLATARGMNMYTGGQWFAIPYHVSQWLVENPLPREYAEYAKYVVVADENYFATLFKNSPYCGDIVSHSLTYYMFDKWEHDKDGFNSTLLGGGDGGSMGTLLSLSLDDTATATATATATGSDGNVHNYKCLSPMPTSCGRSPDTLTMRYRRLLQVSDKLFARKVDPSEASSAALMDHIDRWRRPTSATASSAAGGNGKSESPRSPQSQSQSLQGIGERSLMIRQRRSFSEDLGKGKTKGPDEQHPHEGMMADLCVALTNSRGEPASMRPCNHQDPDQWFVLGPCSGTKRVLLSDEDGTCSHEHAKDECEGEGDGVMESKGGYVDGREDFYCQVQRHPHIASLLRPYGVQMPAEKPNHKSGPDGDQPLCLDISGENPYDHASLLGWPCKASWNQLFRFNGDCSLSAMQPDVIGRIRGTTSSDIKSKKDRQNKQRGHQQELEQESDGDENHVVCVEATAHRMPDKISVQLYSGACQAQQGLVAPYPVNATAPASIIEASGQRFDPLPATGERWKQFSWDKKKN